MRPDWSLLPADLLQTISEKVASIGDYIRFRAVCHPWRSASSPGPATSLFKPPGCYESKGNNDNGTRPFYDLSTAKIHRIDLPETSGVDICGCSHGWLVLHDGKVTSLLNPITCTTITLPSYYGTPLPLGLAPFDALDNFFENWNPGVSTITPTDNFRVRKAILTSSPLDPNCLVFVFTDSLWWLAFCKIGDRRWTVIKFRYSLTWEWNIVDFAHSNGFLYTINFFGHVIIYNLNGPSRRVISCPSIGQYRMYLVEGVFGDILLVENGVPIKESMHTVYKLSKNEKAVWIEVTNLGQNMLFVAGDDHAISLSSANLQLPKWGANCLFCEEPEEFLMDSSALYNHNIKLERIDDGTMTDITDYLGSFRKNRNWQKSFWLTPSFL